jgi:hypothetical protein
MSIEAASDDRSYHPEYQLKYQVKYHLNGESIVRGNGGAASVQERWVDLVRERGPTACRSGGPASCGNDEPSSCRNKGTASCASRSSSILGGGIHGGIFATGATAGPSIKGRQDPLKTDKTDNEQTVSITFDVVENYCYSLSRLMGNPVRALAVEYKTDSGLENVKIVVDSATDMFTDRTFSVETIPSQSAIEVDPSSIKVDLSRLLQLTELLTDELKLSPNDGSAYNHATLRPFVGIRNRSLCEYAAYCWKSSPSSISTAST